MVQFCNLISLLYLNALKKKKKSYFFNTQITINFLDNLWSLKLIWGYKINSKIITVYIKYYLNKPLINYFTVYKSSVQLNNLKWLTCQNQHSLFLLKTSFGYKDQKYCLYYNVSGIIILKIN